MEDQIMAITKTGLQEDANTHNFGNCWNSLPRIKIGISSHSKMRRYELKEIDPKTTQTLQEARQKNGYTKKSI